MSSSFRRPLLVAIGAAIGACAEAPTSATPSAPVAVAPVFAAAQGGGGKSALDLIEDDYSTGLLDRDNVNRFRAYAVHAPAKLPAKYRTAAIGKDATPSMLRQALDWDGLSKATQQEITELRANGFANLKQTLETEHFVLHYTTVATADAVPAVDDDRDGTPDYIEVAARSWEEVWQRLVVELAYLPPKGTPRAKFHVYYSKLSYYGYCMPTNVELQGSTWGDASAYIVVHNDFAGFPPNDVDVTGREPVRAGALIATQAHEFMHALQFALNVYGSGWLMESHATWAEDAVYDEVNDWHWYVNSFLANPEYPIFSRYLYGAAYFHHFLTERYGTDVVRRIWLAHRTQPAPDAVRSVAFGGRWDGMGAFATAQGQHAISDYSTDKPSVVESIRPLAGLARASHASYPVDVTVGPSTNKVANRAPSGLGANYVDFTGASGRLTVSFDGADGYAWRAYVIATPAAGGRPTVLPIALDGSGAGALAVDGMRTRWSRLTLAVTIADRAGVEVPFRYGATAGKGAAIVAD